MEYCAFGELQPARRFLELFPELSQFPEPMLAQSVMPSCTPWPDFVNQTLQRVLGDRSVLSGAKDDANGRVLSFMDPMLFEVLRMHVVPRLSFPSRSADGKQTGIIHGCLPSNYRSTYEEHRPSQSQERQIAGREVDLISPEATGKKRR